VTDAKASKAVLLLGGTGFVGSRLMVRLQAMGREVYILSRKAHTLPALDNCHRFSDSLDNVALLDDILPRCSTVFHLASTSTPGSSAMQPAFEASNNLLPTLRFLETLQRHPNAELVFLSSGGAIYGNVTGESITEEAPLSPVSYYGAGKAAVEKFILAYCTQFKRAAVILRPANFYGPGQPYRAGFGVVPTIFEHIRNGKRFEIWGDGNNIRDYLYIDDFLELCLILVDKGTYQPGVYIYNVGSGKGTTLNALCEMASKVAARKLERIHKAQRAVDVRKIVLDCEAARRDHGWKAHTSLEQGLSVTWDWIKDSYRD
jgi:UDP-glucose 4-epimerase